MSELRDLGFPEKEIKKIRLCVEEVKAVRKLDLNSVRKAFTYAEELIGILGTRILYKDMNAVMTQEAALPMGECFFTGNTYPTCLLDTVEGKFISIKHILLGQTSYEYDHNFILIKKAYLYGDRDILPYNTNPLQYLKFHCMPDEKTAYLNKKERFEVDTSSDDSAYNGFAPIILGIELEVERKKEINHKVERRVAEDLGMEYMIIKADASVPNGFEIVTCPATLKYHLKAWDKFWLNSAKDLQSYHANRCGMHVHISRKCFTPMHLGKMIAFYNNHENRSFITTIAGRSESIYSKFDESGHFTLKSRYVSDITKLMIELRKAKTKAQITSIESKIADIRSKMSACTTISGSALGLTNNIVNGYRTGDAHEDRRAAVNVLKEDTIEVRIFKGNVSKIGMLKNLEFVHAVVEFSREATFLTKVLTEEERAERKLKRKENTDYALHYTYFIDWLAKDETGNYNNLKLWLQEHKITDRFARKKQSSKTPVDKITTDADIRAVA